jgi:hypothetical protein
MLVVFLLLLLLPLPLSVHAEDLGELSANPFNRIHVQSLRGWQPLQAGRPEQSLQSLRQSHQ